MTVRDCLLWPDDRGRSAAVRHEGVVYVSLRQQQQQQRCQSSGHMTQVRQPPLPEDDATVGDALRGWPRYMKHCEQMQQQADADDHPGDDFQKQATTKAKAAATKAGKSKKSNVPKEKEEDIHVADLISQRFLHEYMEQREAEMERDRKKKEARERAAREGRRAAKDRTDIKANKAAQLRAIALADRVEQSPFDLWKMDKFTRSARPHVSTFRNDQGTSRSTLSGGGGGAGHGHGGHAGKRGMQRGGRRSQGTGDHTGSYGGASGLGFGDEEEQMDEQLVGACTCPERLPYYDGRDVYASHHSCADGCLTTDVDMVEDGGDCVYNYSETVFAM